MKIVSTHFVLKDGSDYKDLAPVFPDLLKALLEEIGQMPEEDEILQMYIALNMADLELNRKPEGYNRKGKVRLVFPMDRKEFYLKTYEKFNDLNKIVSRYTEILDNGGIKYEIPSDDNYMALR
ncbi:MAG: hypothetical protein IKR86_05595 [Candidatus Methanomethylophilaceae archaeon]|jgi:hypothetical protein|nr:hypothetical protein [Candidatus Methanomethylophilaceae archaeon]